MNFAAHFSRRFKPGPELPFRASIRHSTAPLSPHTPFLALRRGSTRIRPLKSNFLADRQKGQNMFATSSRSPTLLSAYLIAILSYPILSVSCKPDEIKKEIPTAEETIQSPSSAPPPPKVASKKIQIDTATLGSIYPAIWFDPSEGELIPIVTLSENPPEDRCEIWIEPRDAEFSFAKSLTEVGMAIVGNGEAEFDAFALPTKGHFSRSLPAEALANGKEPVLFVQGKKSHSLLLLRNPTSGSEDWRIEMLWRKLEIPLGTSIGIKAAPVDLRPIGLHGKLGDPKVTELFGEVIVGKGYSATGELADVGMCPADWTMGRQQYALAIGFSGGSKDAEIARITFTPMGDNGLPTVGNPEHIMEKFSQGKSWKQLPPSEPVSGYEREDGEVFITTDGHWISVVDATEFELIKRAKTK